MKTVKNMSHYIHSEYAGLLKKDDFFFILEDWAAGSFSVTLAYYSQRVSVMDVR